MYRQIIKCEKEKPSSLKVQPCKLYNNKYKYMIAPTQITKTEIF